MSEVIERQEVPMLIEDSISVEDGNGDLITVLIDRHCEAIGWYLRRQTPPASLFSAAEMLTHIEVHNMTKYSPGFINPDGTRAGDGLAGPSRLPTLDQVRERLAKLSKGEDFGRMDVKTFGGRT